MAALQEEFAAEKNALRAAHADADAAAERVRAERAELAAGRARLADEMKRWRADAEAEGARLIAEQEALQADRERFRAELTAVQSTVEGREEAVQARAAPRRRPLIVLLSPPRPPAQAQISKATAELQAAERRLAEDRAALRRAAKESEARQGRLADLEAGLRARAAVLESREAEVRAVKDQVRWSMPGETRFRT